MAIDVRVAAVTGLRQVSILDARTPALMPGEALVRVRAAALCTLEQRVYTGTLKPPLPFAGGHEVAGEVAALHESEAKGPWRIGSRVAVRLLYSCGACHYCRSGRTNQCVHAQKKPVREGLLPGPGGLCDLLVVNTDMLFAIPDSLAYEEASLTEPLACCVHSVTAADIGLAEDVVIIGGGVMGQLHILLAKLRGARVVLSEPDAARREMALRSGADTAVDPNGENLIALVNALTGGRGADVVFNTTAVPGVFAQAVALAGKGGRVVQYSSVHPDTPAPVSPQRLHRDETILTGAISPTLRDFYVANRLLTSGLVDVKPLISARFPFDSVGEAFEAAITPGNYRVVVTNWD
jgi:L-iditol 2-dehydrogenase